MSTPEPGWYRDPHNPDGTRWWDGEAWTQQTQTSLATAPPPVPEAPEPQPSRPRRARRRWPLFAGLAALVVVAVVATVLLLNRGPKFVAIPSIVGMTAAEASAALTEAGLVPAPENVSGDGEVGDDWEVSRSTTASQIEVGGKVAYGVQSPLEAAARACDSTDDVGDSGRSLLLDGGYRNADLPTIVCVLVELDVPDSVVSRIDSTRALDGRQDGSWDGINASWTYHPDSGLDIILELAD